MARDKKEQVPRPEMMPLLAAYVIINHHCLSCNLNKIYHKVVPGLYISFSCLKAEACDIQVLNTNTRSLVIASAKRYI